MEGLVMKYFVLTPEKNSAYGHASRMAMIAYSRGIKKADPLLAGDILEWVKLIRQRILAEAGLKPRRGMIKCR